MLIFREGRQKRQLLLFYFIFTVFLIVTNVALRYAQGVILTGESLVQSIYIYYLPPPFHQQGT